MALTITPLLTTLNAADATTGWSTGTLDTVSFIQGTGCLGLKQSSTALNAFVFNNTTGIDMTASDRHFFAWGLAAGAATLATKANGGVRLRLGTTTANYYEWYVDGSDTYTGGWKNWVINPQDDPDATGGSGATLTSVQYFGIVFSNISQYSGNNLTVFADAIRYGTGLQITGAVATTDVGFEEIYSADNSSSNRYGIINKINGVYYTKGELVFGSTGSSTNPDFQDVNSTVVFQDERVSNTLYKINLIGHASDSTNSFRLGKAVGSGATTIGSKGVSIAAAGSFTSAGTYSFVSGTPATITRAAGNFKTDGLKGGMFLQITGTTNNNKNVLCAKVAATTITLATGETLTNESSVASASILGSRRWNFTATDTNMTSLKIYGSTFKQAGTINLGSSATALDPATLELADNTFSNTRQVTRNVTTGSPLYLRNSINFNTNLTASIDLYDTRSTDYGEWKVLQGTGFQSTASAGTRTLTNQTLLNDTPSKPYITVQDSASAVWNMNDPNDGAGTRPTISSGDQDELAFVGTSNGTVNENYTVTWTTQEPDGTAVGTARVKIVASDNGAGSPALESEGSSDGSGDATSTYLRARYVPNGASAITITTHVPAAFKSYKYGKLPFFTSATIDQPVSVTATHLSDDYQVQGTAATAISTGESGTAISIIEASTNENSLIKFTGGSGGTLSNNDTITASGGSPATGQVVGKIIEGNDTAGTIILDNRNASTYDNGETLSNGSGWTATYTNSSEQRFHWIIDAGQAESRSAQTVYDYLMAKLDEATADTSPAIDDLIVDGRAEFGTPFQGVSTNPNKFKTIRNTALTRGWAIANLSSLGSITQFTDNAGVAFAPASTVSVTITVKDESNAVVENARVAIYRNSDSLELINALSDSNGEVSTSYTYTTDVPVTIRVRKSTAAPKYIPVNTSGTIGATGLDATVTFVAESIAESTTSGTIAGDFTISTTLKTIRHVDGEVVIYTARELYTWLMDYFDDSGLMDDTTPMSAQTPTEYTLINGWFMDDTSTQFLNGGAIQSSGWTHPTNTTGIRILTLDAAAGLTSADIGTVVQGGTTGDTGKLLAYDTTLKKLWVRADATDDNFDDVDEAITVDGQACGNMTAASVSGETIYSNIFTLGSIVSGTTMDVYQNDAQITPWWTSGHIDILVKVKEADVEIDSGNITVLARKYGTLYDHYVIDASSGRNPVPLAAFDDGNNDNTEGTVGAYTGITFSFGAKSRDLNNGNGARPYDVEIDCGTTNNTIAEVYEYLKYVTRTSSAVTFTGYGSIPGEFYVAVGDIRFDYDNEGGGGTAFSEGELITGTGGGTPTGYLVSLIDNGSTGTMVLRNVHGTFTDNQVITGGTTGRTAQVNGTIDSIATSKQSPFGTFAGGRFFGARGVYIKNVHADDANNYELLDSTNTSQTPPASVSLVIDGVESGDRVSLFRAVDANGAVNKSMFTISGSQGIGSSTIVVTEAIPNDTPAKTGPTGYLRVVRRDGSGNITDEDRYTYTSWSGSTFTLSGTTSYAYDATDTVYVPYIDEQATGTSVSKSVTFVSNRDVVVRVRKKGIIPFEQKGRQITNTGFSATATRTTDSVVV